MVEDTGVIGMVNAEAEAMFGRPREQLIGQPVELLLPQKMHEAHRRERVGYEAHPTARTMGTGRDLSARRADGSEFPIEIGLSPIRIGGRKMVLCSMVDITVRKRAEQALRESESQLESIIENLSEGVLVCDLEGRLRKCNQTTAAIHGFDSPAALLAQISTAPDVIEFSGMDGQPWSTADFPLARLIRNEAVRHLECRVRRKGRPEWMRVLSWNGTLVPDQQGGSSLAVLTVSDITDRAQAEAERQQSQKLESVGRLAAGVAHEINSPVQYVSDCCHFLRDGVREVSALLLDYQGALESIEQSSRTPQMARDALAKRCEEADLPYLLENMPGAADRAIEGLQRVATIVRSMKEFAHPDQKEKTYADLNQAIASTLTIARNEYKYVADVQTEFGDLPLVPCHLGDFNQAVLNIVINAAHAVESVIAAQGGRGRITVRTRRERGEAVIEIEDTGCGIPEAIRDRIFDPFFTTKPVGKGTGQGLAIARSVIVDRHQGMLSVSSKEGAGTTFTIRLPLDRDGSGLALAA
jgi:PAS domain S-box-containing protein